MLRAPTIRHYNLDVMNILVASCGTRNKIIQYFRKSLNGNGRVIATDASPYAPALYEADTWYQVPRIDAPGYMDIVFDICKKEKADGILSLIDPELSLLSEHKNAFSDIGVTVIGSSKELCDMSLDKLKMYNWLSSHGYDTAKTYDDLSDFEAALQNGDLSFPVFVKPRFGSASLSISMAKDLESVRFLYDHGIKEGKKMIIQEYMSGQEIGADVYIDMISTECVSIFTRNKLVMRAGETDKGISFKDPVLFELIERFVKEAGFKGQIDIDIFNENGKYYISEVNPRFGGGYPHAYECGTDHMSLIVRNLEGQSNDVITGNYESGLVMMKYNELSIVKEV